MSDDNIKVGEEVVEQLTGVADTMAKLLDQVMETHDHQTKDMDYFRRDLGLVRDAIRNIARVLHEGNGEKPLIARVAILETQLEFVAAAIAELKEHFHEEEAQQKVEENISKRGKWALWAAMATGFAALGVEAVRLISGWVG